MFARRRVCGVEWSTPRAAARRLSAAAAAAASLQLLPALQEPEDQIDGLRMILLRNCEIVVVFGLWGVRGAVGGGRGAVGGTGVGGALLPPPPLSPLHVCWPPPLVDRLVESSHSVFC